MNAIEIKHLNVSYYDHLVLNDINLNIPKGVMCAISGPNGAGKTTLVKSILNFIPHLTGSIKINGKDLKQEIDNISYVPQKESVNWQFPTTVSDVVLMGTYRELGWFKRPGKTQKDKANQAMKQLGILDLANKEIASLSGGQQQRVFLARMLCQDADIIFLDEPLVGIDKKSEQIIMNILNQLKEEGKTIIVVHHDLATIEKYFDYLVLVNHKIVASGYVKDIFTPDNINQAYGEFNGDL